MLRLKNRIQNYAWGSRSAIAELLGERTPSAEPEAELWLGAHPKAPSVASTPAGEQPLGELIASNPERYLGERVRARFGDKLPFLFKVLAAAEPLSLQAHPSAERARERFAAEDAAGIPRNAPERNYRDPNHKPELLCALDDFEALCGFRSPERARAVLESLAVAELAPLIDALSDSNASRALRNAFTLLMSLDDAARIPLVRRTAEACARRADEDALALTAELHARYPGDPGVVASLLLEHVRLAPGEAIFLPAGNLHAYVRGTGVELMANSDNVLRGGLTPKHVDRDELLAVLDFEPVGDPRLRPEGTGPERSYVTPVEEFALSRVELGGAPHALRVSGPEIVLCVRGTVILRGADGSELALARGQSAFVPAATERYELAGEATLFRARTAVAA